MKKEKYENPEIQVISIKLDDSIMSDSEIETPSHQQGVGVFGED